MTRFLPGDVVQIRHDCHLVREPVVYFTYDTAGLALRNQHVLVIASVSVQDRKWHLVLSSMNVVGWVADGNVQYPEGLA